MSALAPLRRMTCGQLAGLMRRRTADWPDLARTQVGRIASTLGRARTNADKLAALDTVAALRRLGAGPHHADLVTFASLATVAAKRIEG